MSPDPDNRGMTIRNPDDPSNFIVIASDERGGFSVLVSQDGRDRKSHISRVQAQNLANYFAMATR